YARRSKSLEVLIPILYLKGVSTGDFEEALVALLGKDAGGLSASTIGRLKDAWSDEQLEQARSVRQALRLLLGRRHPRPGSPGGRSPVLARHHWCHARGQEGTRRSHRWRARERPILAGTAPRPEAARVGHRARARSR